VEVAAGDALEQHPDVEGLELHLLVAEILLQDHLRQVRDGDVLRPPDVSKGEGLALGRTGTGTPTPPTSRHESRDREGHRQH
jgi:hypothetical protein